MLDLFKRGVKGQVQDVKMVRETLLQFIKEELRKTEGGEGNNIKGLQLFIACPPEEKHLYESALYFDEGDRFKNEEVQKIADDFAIDLPANWTMEISFIESLPPEAIRVNGLDAALIVLTRKRLAQQVTTAYLKVRKGEAEKDIYAITSTSGKICIGRERKGQTADGFYRENEIAFPEQSENESNRFVSRQHAHIEFDMESGVFLLFADEGGVPPRNKIKVRSLRDSNPIKLYTTQIGYPLQEGDQILLGESALLEFTYKAEENKLF